LYKLSPIDTNFIPSNESEEFERKPLYEDYIHGLPLLRLELVSQFYEYKYLNFIQTKIAEVILIISFFF